MRKSQITVVGALCGVAVSVGAAVALSSGESTAAAPTAAPVVSALSAGTANGAAASARAVLTSDAVSSYGPSLESARTVPAPAGGTPWTLVPAKDGGACLVISSGDAGCGSGEAIATGRFGLIVIEPTAAQAVRAKEARDAARSQPDAGASQGEPVIAALNEPGGEATRYGLAPDGIAAVEAVSKDGTTIGKARVVDNAYALSLGDETQAASATIRFVDEDGGIAFAWDVR